ncbi:MAG: twin-arginine translocase subunit TatB [Candidatus Electrothrix sp. AX2]|nr:twin-arginine translocase subunit TatB [Candidatus Electrothrix gigas]
MFGIGLPEMIVILAVALIVVGPDKLPELARSLAKGVNELKNTMNQVKGSLNEETKIVSSVQHDIQQTAGQMKTQLLEDITVTKDPQQWKQEGEEEEEKKEKSRESVVHDDGASGQKIAESKSKLKIHSNEESEKSHDTAEDREESRTQSASVS